METAEMYDRIHLRTTYYNYARHLESKGDINGAIPKYGRFIKYQSIFSACNLLWAHFKTFLFIYLQDLSHELVSFDRTDYLPMKLLF